MLELPVIQHAVDWHGRDITSSHRIFWVWVTLWRDRMYLVVALYECLGLTVFAQRVGPPTLFLVERRLLQE